MWIMSLLCSLQSVKISCSFLFVNFFLLPETSWVTPAGGERTCWTNHCVFVSLTHFSSLLSFVLFLLAEDLTDATGLGNGEWQLSACPLPRPYPVMSVSTSVHLNMQQLCSPPSFSLLSNTAVIPIAAVHMLDNRGSCCISFNLTGGEASWSQTNKVNVFE